MGKGGLSTGYTCNEWLLISRTWASNLPMKPVTNNSGRITETAKVCLKNNNKQTTSNVDLRHPAGIVTDVYR